MSLVITEAQKREIEGLAKDHSGALIAMGADMYRRGIVAGVFRTVVGTTIGVVAVKVYQAVKSNRP